MWVLIWADSELAVSSNSSLWRIKSWERHRHVAALGPAFKNGVVFSMLWEHETPGWFLMVPAGQIASLVDHAWGDILARSVYLAKWPSSFILMPISWNPWNLSFRYSLFHEKRLQTMQWHQNARVYSHQRWQQMRFCVSFHLWCELTSTMNVTEWQVSWNSWLWTFSHFL